MTASRWLLLALALVAAMLAGLMFGTLPLSGSDVLHGVLGDGTAMQNAVIRELRLPRVLLAALVGAGLGAAGAALQGATRNALAEPYLLGVSGGAAVGAVVAVALHAPSGVIPRLASPARSVRWRSRCSPRERLADVVTPVWC